MKEHDEPLHEIDFVPSFEEISVEFEEGQMREVRMHDGSRIMLKKLGKDPRRERVCEAAESLTEIDLGLEKPVSLPRLRLRV